MKQLTLYSAAPLLLGAILIAGCSHAASKPTAAPPPQASPQVMSLDAAKRAQIDQHSVAVMQQHMHPPAGWKPPGSSQ